MTHMNASTPIRQFLQGRSSLTMYKTKPRRKYEGLRKNLLTALIVFTLLVSASASAWGQAIKPDWSIKLNTEANFKLFKVIDNNNDQSTWIFYTDGSGQSSACYVYNSQNEADDWLVTPAITLQAGVHYRVSFHAKANSDYYKENLEVKAAMNASASSLSEGTEIMPNTQLGSENRQMVYTFTPTKNGDYYIGFHAVSPADANRLFLYDVSVTVGAADNAPSPISNLTVTPDATGELAAKIQFTTPSTKVDGTAINTLDSVVISRNGTRIATLTDVAPNSKRTYDDNDVTQNGDNTYSLTAYAGGLGSNAVTATEYIGVVPPTRPASFTITDNTTSIATKWNKVTTPATEGRFNPERLNYEIFGFDSNNQPTQEIVTVNGDTTFTMNTPTNEGDQHMLQYAIRAANQAGASDFTYSNAIITGAPYALPYRESFINKGIAGFQHFWWMDGEGNGYYYGISTIAFDQSSSDGDNASLKFSIYGYNDKLNLKTGKIKLTNSNRLKMAFDYRTDGADKCVMNVGAIMQDGSVVNLQKFSLANASSWQKAVVNLPFYLGLLDHVMLQIQMECQGSPADVQTLYIDNVNIADAANKDLSVSLSLPQRVQRGKEAQLKVRVSNMGSDDATAYQLNVKVGNKTVLTQNVTEKLAAFGYRDFIVNYKPSAVEGADSITVNADVTLSGDEDMNNNSTSGKFGLYDYDGMTISNLEGKENDGHVNLIWMAPATHNESVTESFESYAPWLTTGIGEWITIANDNAIAGSLFDDLQMPHEHENYAFMVTNFEPDYHAGAYYPGHSGYSYLSSVYGITTDGTAHAATDHWLISPDLSGNAQTISFYAMKHDAQANTYNERVNVLYSTTDTNIESFTIIGDTTIISGNDWQLVSASIPEGARYFAIESKNEPGTCNWLTIDDITYERGTGYVKCYRIYRDGELIGTSNDATSFTDTTVQPGTHTYQVTVLYVNGNESAPLSVTVTVGTTGIESIVSDGSTFKVYSLNGTLIKDNATSLNGLAKGVYVINGKKVLVK